MPSHVPANAIKPSAVELHGSASFPYFLSGCWSRLLGRTQSLLAGRRAAGGQDGIEAREGDGSDGDTAPFRPGLPPATDGKTVPAFVSSYRRALDIAWLEHDWSDVVSLVETLQRCWREDRQVFLCGNGGSAANAIHLANDLLYGVDKTSGRGLRVTALPSNAAVLTCLANDIAYADIFAQQLTVLAKPRDVLIAFSGSGNSPNILRALRRAREIGVTTFAILGFDGGAALALADHPIHFPVHDMQVAEDLQMMVGHMAMQWLSRRR